MSQWVGVLAIYILIGVPVGYFLTKSEIRQAWQKGKIKGFTLQDLKWPHRFAYAILIAVYWPFALGRYAVLKIMA